MKEKRHKIFDDVKEKFESLNIKFVSLIDTEQRYFKYEDYVDNKEPVFFYGYYGQEDNGINGQFEVEDIDIIHYENIDSCYKGIVCDIFETNYPNSELQDAYGTLWDSESATKIFNAYGDEDNMDERIGFYDLGITPVTIIYVAKKNEVFIESADLIYDYFDKEYRWINYIKFPVDPKIGPLIKELGVGKRGYYRKEKHFSFRVCDGAAFKRVGFSVNEGCTTVFIPVSEIEER